MYLIDKGLKRFPWGKEREGTWNKEVGDWVDDTYGKALDAQAWGPESDRPRAQVNRSGTVAWACNLGAKETDTDGPQLLMSQIA